MIESWLEPGRRWLRKTLSYDSAIYRTLSLVLTVLRLLQVEGLHGLLRVGRASRSNGSEVTLKLRSLIHPILVRPGTSDLAAVVNNVVRAEYGQFPTSIEPSVIIDAGAYIGDTAAYYLSRFPAARVIALEPVEEHYRLATRNLDAYGDRITLKQVALSDRVGRTGLEGSGMTAQLGGETAVVRTTNVRALMQEHGLEHIDILKLDIEGAEGLVLGPGCDDWLENTEWIVVELHGEENRRRVLGTLDARGFGYFLHRNLMYCRCQSIGPV